MTREVEQVRAYRGADTRIEVGPVSLPEGTLRAVACDQLALAVEHQRLEAAALVCLGRAHEQQRRLRIHRLALRVGPIRLRRVLVPLLLEIQVSERRVEQCLVGRGPVPVEY